MIQNYAGTTRVIQSHENADVSNVKAQADIFFSSETSPLC